MDSGIWVGIPLQPHFTHSSPAEVNRDLEPIVGHNIREDEIDRCHLAETHLNHSQTRKFLGSKSAGLVDSEGIWWNGQSYHVSG